MLKKIMSIVLTLAMLCSVDAAPVHADGETVKAIRVDSVNSYFTGSYPDGYEAKKAKPALLGKSDGDTANKITMDCATNASAKQDFAYHYANTAVVLSSGDKVKISVQVAVDDNSKYLNGNYIMDLGLTKTTYKFEDTYGTTIGFNTLNGTLQKWNGITPTTSNVNMVPSFTWCTYDVVYTIGDPANDGKDTMSVYADGVAYAENLKLNTNLTQTSGAVMRNYMYAANDPDALVMYFDRDNFQVTHYPTGYTGDVVNASAFNENALNDNNSKFAKLADGSLHYIGSQTQPTADEMDALVTSGSGVTTEFVSSVDEANDPGRIGYIRMTYADGTERYKKVMGGTSVDMISLDFNGRVSLADSSGNIVSSGIREGGYMTNVYNNGTQNTHYTVKYVGGLEGKSDGNYAVQHKTEFADGTTALNSGQQWGMHFSTYYGDSSYRDSSSGNTKMSVSGIISYEFSLRFNSNDVNDKFKVRVYSDKGSGIGAAASAVHEISAFEIYNDLLYYSKTDSLYTDASVKSELSSFDKTQWHRYAFIVDTINDTVKIYRDGVLKCTKTPSQTAEGTALDVKNVGPLELCAFNLSGDALKTGTHFQVDDVVIRSVTSAYAPEKLAPSVSAGWINNSYGFIKTSAGTLPELTNTMSSVPEGSEVKIYNADGTESNDVADGDTVIVKNADESLMKYYTVKLSDAAVTLNAESLENISGTTTSALTFGAGDKQLSVSFKSYKDTYQDFKVVLAAYNDNELIGIASKAGTEYSDGATYTYKVRINIPDSQTVTSFKAFVLNDKANTNTMKPWTASVEWKNK